MTGGRAFPYAHTGSSAITRALLVRRKARCVIRPTPLSGRSLPGECVGLRSLRGAEARRRCRWLGHRDAVKRSLEKESNPDRACATKLRQRAVKPTRWGPRQSVRSRETVRCRSCLPWRVKQMVVGLLDVRRSCPQSVPPSPRASANRRFAMETRSRGKCARSPLYHRQDRPGKPLCVSLLLGPICWLGQRKLSTRHQ